MKEQRMNRLTKLLTIGLLATLFGCRHNNSKNTNYENSTIQPITKPVENISATKEQIERRSKSEKFCKSKSLPVYENPNSLYVETDEKVSIRAQEEVVD